MTSHTEYISTQDEAQLTNLIEVATRRLEDLKQGGWTRLWVVADCCNSGWFPHDQYAQAAEFLLIRARVHAKEGKPFELSIEEGKCRPADAERLFASTHAELARMAKLLG